MCNNCASLAGLVLSFIACFILLVIALLSPPSWLVGSFVEVAIVVISGKHKSDLREIWYRCPCHKSNKIFTI